MRRSSALVVTAAIVAAASVVMFAAMGRAVAGLVAALVGSYLIALRPIRIEQLRRAVPAYLTAVAAQAVHMIEEYRAGFYREFPPVWGAAPWSSESFLVFNLAWLLVFGLAAVGLKRGWWLAVVVALFLALGGGVLNGIGHAALAVRAGGYFPGLYTAPLVFCAGLYLASRLLRRSRVALAAIQRS